MSDPRQLSTYDYLLPPELIAQHPLAERDASRLMVLDRSTGSLHHSVMRSLPQWLNPGDALVLNNSRVVPARLVGTRTATGGKWEGLFVRPLPDETWELIGQTRGRLQEGESVTVPAVDGSEATLTLTLLRRCPDGIWTWRPTQVGSPVPLAPCWNLLDQFGSVPLPPYIERPQPEDEDQSRYQTVYAAAPGSIAAPTAGLHFTQSLLQQCHAKQVATAAVTLHVGIGTFRPVQVNDVRDHTMHEEWCELPSETAELLTKTRAAGGRVIAVGTTSLRTLETAAVEKGQPFCEWSGTSRLFVYPPYQFRAVDALLTNFHLPKSTLMMLVSAFAGLELTRAAYQAAIAERYRFFSYGDAMLIV
jgi:S-adenosylmethionine:tRNA ribosyltransferase-isomerase